MKVLVTVASKHGSTYEIAKAIGSELATRGLDASVVPVQDVQCASGKQPAPTRRRSPHGWGRRSPLTRFPRTGCERRCRSEHIEPPGRIERIIGAARSAASDRFCATTAARLGRAAADRLEQLVADRGEEDDEGGGRGVLGELKADPGQISLDSLLAEVDKLERIRSLGLPAGLFAGAPRSRGRRLAGQGRPGVPLRPARAAPAGAPHLAGRPVLDSHR